MTHLATGRRRLYASPLRAQQAEETRARILEAALRVMAAGLAHLSVPAVAREAGVSIATVYRHFGTKRDLIAAVYPHLARRAGLSQISVPESVEGYRGMVLNMFSRLESLGEVARVAMASPASEDARRMQMPTRQAMSRQFVATVMPDASVSDQKRLSRVLLVLTGSSAMRMWRDHLGASVDEAADDIVWIIRLAITGTNGRKKR